MKIKIRHDVYDISNRIKKIDKNYYIVFNTSRACFELHNLGQVKGSYCLTLPFSRLDARVLNLIYKTKSENLKNLIEEIERSNKQVESKEKQDALHLFNLNLENLLKRR